MFDKQVESVGRTSMMTLPRHGVINGIPSNDDAADDDDTGNGYINENQNESVIYSPGFSTVGYCTYTRMSHRTALHCTALEEEETDRSTTIGSMEHDM